MKFIEKYEHLEIVVTVHALDRFSERVLCAPILEDEIMNPKQMDYIQNLIHEDMHTNHKYIYEIGSGMCVSSTYDCVYVIKDFKVHTVKYKTNEHFREISGGRLKNKCKNSKYLKKKLNEYKSR